MVHFSALVATEWWNEAEGALLQGSLEVISDPFCEMTCVGSVRQLAAAWLWESAAQPAMWEQVLSLSEDDKPRDYFHFSQCFSWHCGTGSVAEKKKVPLCRESCEEVFCFDSFHNAEVIVTLKLWVHSLCSVFRPTERKGIQAWQTWNARLQQDGSPHESI